MDVTGRIRQLMDKRGWTEYRLVKETKLPASTISNIFHRNSTPSIITLESICSAFGISLSQFFAEGNFVALTPEQETLLDRWATISDEQKQLLLDLIEKMNKS